MSEIDKAIMELNFSINTYQNMLNNELGTYEIKIIQDNIEACKTAISALEKQVAKNAKSEIFESPIGKCKAFYCVCGERVRLGDKYCSTCGQKLEGINE